MKNDRDAGQPLGAVPRHKSASGADPEFDALVASFWADIGKMNGQDYWDKPVSHAALTVRTEGLARSLGERIFGKPAINGKT